MRLDMGYGIDLMALRFCTRRHSRVWSSPVRMTLHFRLWHMLEEDFLIRGSVVFDRVLLTLQEACREA